MEERGGGPKKPVESRWNTEQGQKEGTRQKETKEKAEVGPKRKGRHTTARQRTRRRAAAAAAAVTS